MDSQREALSQAGQEYTEANEALGKARKKLRSTIVDALEAGMTPTEVNRLSPFTPAYNRRIAEDAGLAPRPRGPKKKP